MKLASGSKSTVASQGIKGSSGFGIANTAHMFGILSDGLYSDKIGAVLREIGCNAMDAHIMGGTAELPFEVKLPSRLDSTFHIKDFGPGLDDQEVRELYTTYGWSSKQNSDEVTGAFGLGSKSPFAYTDSFSICSVKAGVKRVYTAHKDDDGKPVVSLMSECESNADWTQGIMVTFAVAPEDVAEFVQKAGNIFRWFKVKPTVLGAKLDLSEPKFGTRGSNFAIGAKEDIDKMARVVMANVAYPLNASRLDGLDDVSQAILGCDVHLFLATGAVMPTPNREDLQYDKSSRPMIAAALHAAAVEVAKEIYARVNAEKTKAWQWHRKIREYAESLPSSIRYKIGSMLALVTVDKAELKVLENLFNEAICTVPNWVGNGRDAPHIGLLRDANGKVLRDVNGDVQEDKKNYDARGCRVWYYWVDRNSRGTNPVKRKEVVNGHIRLSSNAEPTALTLKYTENVTVMVADTTRADMRVKWHLDTAGGEDHKVLMVVPVRGADKPFAEAYAQLVAGDSAKGLGGVPLEKVSSINLPKEVVDRAKSTRLTLVEKREVFLEEDFTYFSLTDPTTPAQSVTVADMDQDTDKFYVLVREANNVKRYYNMLADGGQYCYDSKGILSIVKSISKLRQLEGFPGITGFFAFRSDEVKKLKLTDDGWKPALLELDQQLKSKAWTDKLGVHADTSPTIRLDDDWMANRAGFPGVMARACKIASPFFGQVKRLMPDHPMVQLANRLAALSQISANTAPAGESVEAVLAELNRALDQRCKVVVPAFTRPGDSEVSQMAFDAYPRLRLLDIGHFVKVAKASPELAASLFWQFATLDSEGSATQLKALQKLAT